MHSHESSIFENTIHHYFMTQEYDISEFWEQYDERSVFIGDQKEKEDEFISLVDQFIELEESKDYDVTSEEEKVEFVEQESKKRKIERQEQEEKIIKKMYGIRDKHRDLLTEEDRMIKNRLEEIFTFMKNQNT